MKTITSLWRRTGLVALAIALTALGARPAFADLDGAALLALQQLNAGLTHPVTLSSTSVSITAAELKTLIQEPAVTSGSLSNILTELLSTIDTASANSDLKTGAANVATGVTNLVGGVLSDFNTANSTFAGASLTGSTATLESSYLAGATEVLMTDSYYNHVPGTFTETTKDTDEKSTLNSMISTGASISTNGDTNPNDYIGIITDSLLGSDAGGAPGTTGANAAKAALLAAETASTKIPTAPTTSGSALTLGQILQAVAQDDSSVIGTGSAQGSFLYTLVAAEGADSLTNGDPRRVVLEGYTAGLSNGQTASNLAVTASNIMFFASGTNSLFTAQNDVFVGLAIAGSATQTATIGALVPAILANLNKSITATHSQDYNTDAARATLASTFISDYASNAGVIAGQAATQITDPVDDGYSFAYTLTGNTNVKTDFVDANGIVGVTGTLAAAYTGTSNLGVKVEISQAGIKNSGTNAAPVQGITGGVYNEISADSGITNKLQAADNYIQGVDTPTVGEFSTIAAAVRANAAIGLVLSSGSSIPNFVAEVTGTAVNTETGVGSSVLNVNGVAQPIFQALVNAGSNQTGNAAAQIINSLNGENYGPAATLSTYTLKYAAAQLILAAKATATTPNLAVVDAISTGFATASDASYLATYTGAGGVTGTDGFLVDLSGQMASAAQLPWLKEVAKNLSTSPGLNDVEVVGDFAATGAAPLQSGTISAYVALSATSDATAIAYAGAAGTGVLTDAARTTIAVDVYKNIAGTGASISGSVGTLVSGSTTLTTLASNKGTLAKDMAVVTGTVNAGYATTDAAIVLAVSQTVASNDPTLNTDLGAITVTAVSAFTGLKTVGTIDSFANGVALNYTGAYTSSTTSSLGYANVAIFAGDVNTHEVVTGLSDSLANLLVPEMINGNSDSVTTAQTIGVDFAASLPKSVLAIGTAATTPTLYTVSDPTYGAEQSGSIAEAITASLPTSTATLLGGSQLLSGSLAVIAAVNGTPTGGQYTYNLNNSLASVAGVYYANLSGTTYYQATATRLGIYALVANGTNAYHNMAVPAIFAAFAPSLGGASEATVAAWMAKLLGSAAGDANDYYNAADIFGVALQNDSSVQNLTAETALITAIGSDIGSAAWAALAAQNNDGLFTGATTLAEQKAVVLGTLHSGVYVGGLLNTVITQVTNNRYGTVTANETPVVQM